VSARHAEFASLFLQGQIANGSGVVRVYNSTCFAPQGEEPEHRGFLKGPGIHIDIELSDTLAADNGRGQDTRLVPTAVSSLRGDGMELDQQHGRPRFSSLYSR